MTFRDVQVWDGPVRSFLSCPMEFPNRFRAKRDQLATIQGLLHESQGQNLALTVSFAPYSLDSGYPQGAGSDRPLPPLPPYCSPT